MDWFETLTGFRELDYAQTRQQLEVVGDTLRSNVNGKSYGVGTLELASLKDLRERVNVGPGLPGRLQVSIVRGDVRAMHSFPENAGALFQVASQFNLLEMVSPEVTPERGVTGYQEDGTQGPACAMAAGAAAIYRNYFCNVDGQVGQTSTRQLDGLADIGVSLSAKLGKSLDMLWSMRNGYAMCTREGLDAISAHLAKSSAEQVDDLRSMLRIGVHNDVEVSDRFSGQPVRVSQVFCSALPVAYGNARVPTAHWEAFGKLILEAAYEATLWAGVLNAQRTGSNIVLLTRLGGGVFGNDAAWIDSAIRRALSCVSNVGLDVRLVSFREPSEATCRLVNGSQK